MSELEKLINRYVYIESLDLFLDTKEDIIGINLGSTIDPELFKAFCARCKHIPDLRKVR